MPFKPDSQPDHVQIVPAASTNILTALADNQHAVEKDPDPVNKAIALAWLFRLVGDIHQPLHTAQLFTVDNPQGDRGRNEICIRVTQAGQPMDLHRRGDYITRPRARAIGAVLELYTRGSSSTGFSVAFGGVVRSWN